MLLDFYDTLGGVEIYTIKGMGEQAAMAENGPPFDPLGGDPRYKEMLHNEASYRPPVEILFELNRLEEEIAEAMRRDAEDLERYQRGEWQPTPKPTEPVDAPPRGLLRWLTDVTRLPLRKR